MNKGKLIGRMSLSIPMLLAIFAGMYFACTCMASAPIPAKDAGLLSEPPSASVTAKWEVIIDEDGLEILTNPETGEKIGQALHFDENGNLAPFDLHDYADLLNSLPAPVDPADLKDTAAIPPVYDTNSLAPYYEFKETSHYTELGSSLKMSADVVGPATITHVVSSTVTDSYGGSVSIGTAIKRAIQTGASFTWNQSLPSSDQLMYAYAFQIPEGKTGYVQFRPRLNVTQGDLYYIVTYPYKVERTNTETVWGKSPVALSGNPSFLDGVYEIAYR